MSAANYIQAHLKSSCQSNIVGASVGARHRRRRRLSALLAAIPLGLCGMAWGQSDYWLNPAGGDWWTSGPNWSLGAPPAQDGQDAVFNLGSTSSYTVTSTQKYSDNMYGNLTRNLNIQNDKVALSGALGYWNLINIGNGPGQNATFTLNPGAAIISDVTPGTGITIGTQDGTGIGQVNLNASSLGQIQRVHNIVNGFDQELHGLTTMVLWAGTINAVNQSTLAGVNNTGLFVGGGSGTAALTLDNSTAVFPGGLAIGTNGSASLTNNSVFRVNVSSFLDGEAAIFDVDSQSNTPATLSIDHSQFYQNAYQSQANIGVGGKGAVTITNGGSLSLFSGPTGVAIGGSGGTGSILASGTNSRLVLDWKSYIGTDSFSHAGTGLVQLSSNASGSFNNMTVAAGGTLKVNSGASLKFGRLDLSSAGAYDFAGASLTIGYNNSGILIAPNFTLPSTSSLIGQGTVSGSFTNSGSVSTGGTTSGPPVLTITGNYVQSPGAVLNVGIGFQDKFQVGGNATWAGALNVLLDSGISFPVGQQFTILGWGSEIGTFNTVSLPTLPAGQVWDTSALYTTGTIKDVAGYGAIWTNSGGGTWGQNSNWQNNAVPDASSAVATLGNATSGPFNITLDGNHTLGTLNFTSTNSYTVSSGSPASSALIFDQGVNNAAINVTAGNHNIAAPIQLHSTLAVSISPTNSTLTLAGPISGAGALNETGAGTLVLSHANTYAGPTTIANGASLVLGAAGALPTSTIITNDGQMTVNANNTVTAIGGSNPNSITGSLSIGGGTTLQIAPASGGSYQQFLTIAPGGLLDLTNNSFALNYVTLPSPNTQIRNYISNGYNAGHALWSGATGITSSTAAADKAHHSIAFADGADGVVINLPAGITPALPQGGTLAPGTELITYAYAGDANLDGKVDFSDFIILSNHFGASDINWDHGNFNCDGKVDFSDFIVLSNNFGAGTSGNGIGATPQELAQYNAQARSFGISESQIATWDQAISNLPEPASIGMLALAGVSLLRPRRGKMCT